MPRITILKDINGIPLYVPTNFPDIRKSATLAANTEATITVPDGTTTGNFFALFRYQAGTTVYFSLNGIAEVPVGGTFADTTSCGPNFTGLQVETGDILSFITADTTADVGVELYEL